MARILLIDDDADLVQLLSILLKNSGYEVSSAGDAAEGLDVCRKFHPDLMILDYHLPGSTGAHLFETFRRNKATQRTPILFMSAIASADDILCEIDDPDISRFMPKPVNTKEFLRNIEEMVEIAARISNE
jgi:DNA-binding response OmpR family regulator